MMAATSTLQSGRLLTATVPNSRRVTLLYNGLGEMARARTETRSGNQWTTPYWEYASFAPDGRALGLIQENTSRTEWEWVWLDNLPVVQFQDGYNSSGTYTGTTVTYLHPDQLGTPRIGTSTAGAISWRYRSDAFGVATISGTHTVRLRLPGQIDLGTGGINYNYFRDYDPQIGRYLESDPIGLKGGLNSYLYALGNPVRFSDPRGELSAIAVGIGVTATVVGGGLYLLIHCAETCADLENDENCPADDQDERDRQVFRCKLACVKALGGAFEAWSVGKLVPNE